MRNSVMLAAAALALAAVPAFGAEERPQQDYIPPTGMTAPPPAGRYTQPMIDTQAMPQPTARFVPYQPAGVYLTPAQQTEFRSALRPQPPAVATAPAR
jgi:hypothetical protein